VAIKADGLAAGKGVILAHTTEEARRGLEWLIEQGGLGEAGRQVLLEEFLSGPELSVLAFTDGRAVAPMPPARDYKRVGEGDTGANTGGMGGYTWPSYATPDLLSQVEHSTLRPTVAQMAAEGQPYRGVLYCGLMLTPDGPRVLEFNCRFGDPEAQLILPLLDCSLLEVCESVCEGRLVQPRWREALTCGVVLAAPGYPERPRVGGRITGLHRLPGDVLAFHAGTAVRPFGDQGALCSPGPPARDPNADGAAPTATPDLVTSGGRVVTLVGQADTLEAARARVYAAVPLVTFEGVHYRRDIGQEAQAAVAV
jgi:phosphoribosylamine--glycine ligase